MKDIFISWIIFQLVVIGVAGMEMYNQMIDGKYNCERTIAPVWIGVAVPLMFFVPETTQEIKYCNR